MAEVERTRKLYDVRKLDLLAQEKEAAGREGKLLDKVEPLVERVIRSGLALGGQSAARPPSPGTFEKATPAPGFGAGAVLVFIPIKEAQRRPSMASVERVPKPRKG